MKKNHPLTIKAASEEIARGKFLILKEGEKGEITVFSNLSPTEWAAFIKRYTPPKF